MVPPERVHHITRAEYQRMVAAGLFADQRIELLLGQLVDVSPQRAPHASAVMKLNRLLTPRLENRAEVRVQLPFAATEDSEPEPGIAIVPCGDYDQDHPNAAHLVIEVAETTLTDDRTLKSAIYFQAGVPEYWIVNLLDEVIEVFRRAHEGYMDAEVFGRGAQIPVPGFEDLHIEVSEVLPRRQR